MRKAHHSRNLIQTIALPLPWVDTGRVIVQRDFRTAFYFQGKKERTRQRHALSNMDEHRFGNRVGLRM